MPDLGRRNCVKSVICLACLVGFVVLLVHVTADDDHEEDMSDGNRTMENSTRICDLNCTNIKIEELQSEISENFTFLVLIGFTLLSAIGICYSCWRGGKGRLEQLDRSLEEMQKKIKKFEDEFEEVKGKVDSTPAVKTSSKITASLIPEASPYHPEPHGNSRKSSLTDPEALSPPSPAFYSTPPTSLVQKAKKYQETKME